MGLPKGERQGQVGPGKKRLRPAPNVSHVHFSEHRVQAEACGCAFEACRSAKQKLVYQVVICTFCGSVHVDMGKYKKFNHASHKCFHCSLFFQSSVPCVGVEPVVQQPVSSLVTNHAARSNVAPALDMTCPVEECLLVASGCTASIEH